jgi:hypothetical protein
MIVNEKQSNLNEKKQRAFKRLNSKVLNSQMNNENLESDLKNL